MTVFRSPVNRVKIMNNEEKIIELKENLTNALQIKDAESVTETFADKTVMMLLPAPPLRFKTGENSPGANGIEDWFATFDGDIGLESKEFEIVAGETVAFCHCLEHLTGKRTDGTTTDVWYRETLGLRKIAGEWKIAHQHQSVPYYMDSLKAAIDLKPE